MSRYNNSTSKKKWIPLAEPHLGSLERRYLLEAYDSGWISSKGEFLRQFENTFARFISSSHGVTTSNGTTAIHLALAALGIGRGDEVIVPDLTFISPANCVTYTGARAVFADSNLEYWGVDADSIAKRITKKTKAVIVVHLYGHPVDIDPILELCEKKGIDVIEDCAEAHGAEYRGKRVGSFGRISCFSFYGNKILTTGEGGMCLTKEEGLDSKMRILRDHGMKKGSFFWHENIGFNYRMTNLQAAIGYAQMKTLNETIAQYREIGHKYSKEIGKEEFVLHPEMQWAKCVFWMYSALIKGITRTDRDRIIARLSKRGIESRPVFYPVSKLPPYERFNNSNTNATHISEMGISLPTHLHLRESDIWRISDTLKQEVNLMRTR
ncbi:MAG: DegT/DnrJ/EryC1/StrS family aminotransferase [Nitrososphaerota archaeon]|jgi:perosamine synthetase|nr:DegT/DnrJ/EryC1/StrS family aminotransferase [Nitrososphaerota archaeon]MDG6924035.1 DegT/DnrJ/EryC1/StrS family aminotransferase [Nitrososphaerota archaeon]